MGARQQLNLAYFHGCLLIAAVVGSMARSWTVFPTTPAVLVGGARYTDQIRPAGRRR